MRPESALLCENDTMRVSTSILLLALLAAACTPSPEPIATPVVQVPTLTPTLVVIDTPTAFVRPTLPPTFTPIGAPEAEATEPPTLIVDPLMGFSAQPPLDITLPDGWDVYYRTWGFNDAGRLTALPFAFYEGPVTGGSGKLVLLYAFANAASSNPLRPDFAQPNLYIDGLRLLRSVVFICADLSVAAQYDNWYIGDVPATGSTFDAANCGVDVPDTQGWFIGTQVGGLNFMFYAYTDPGSALDGPARAELEAIINSVVFRPEDFRAEATPEVTAEAAP